MKRTSQNFRAILLRLLSLYLWSWQYADTLSRE